MDANEQVLQRLDELVREAEEIGATRELDGGTLVPYNPWISWRVSAYPLVADLTGGKESQYYQDFERVARRRDAENLSAACAILRRVRDDYAKGYILGVLELAAAEVFTDFLDMAEHLLSNSYHVPAATVAGAVLEDSLRRLYVKHVGPLEPRATIGKLNKELADRKHYPVTDQKAVESWAAIRNAAAHPDWDAVKPESVSLMIQGIRGFIARHKA